MKKYVNPWMKMDIVLNVNPLCLEITSKYQRQLLPTQDLIISEISYSHQNLLKLPPAISLPSWNTRNIKTAPPVKTLDSIVTRSWLQYIIIYCCMGALILLSLFLIPRIERERERKKKEQTFWNNEVLTFWAPHFTFLQQYHTDFFSLYYFYYFYFHAF